MATKSETRSKRELKPDFAVGKNEIPTPRLIETQAEQPEPEWVRGTCPECGASLVSNMYYIGGKGYLVVWECWRSLSEHPRCTYRRVL